MKDYLFCHIKNCGFKVGVDMNATESDCLEAIRKFKDHLRSHPIHDVIDHLYGLIMTVRDKSEQWSVK